MPFKSEKQRKYLWANEPEIARDWTDTYGSRIQKAGGQLVQPGPGRPGYNGQGDYTPDRSPGRSAPGGGASRDVLTGQRDHGQTVAYHGPREKDLVQTKAGDYRKKTIGDRVDDFRQGSIESFVNRNKYKNLVRAGVYPNKGPFIAKLLNYMNPPDETEDFDVDDIRHLYAGGADPKGLAGLRRDFEFEEKYDRPTQTQFEDYYGLNKPPDIGGEGGEEWQRLGYPSYAAWLAAQGGGSTVDDTTTTVVDSGLGSGHFRVPEQYRVAEGGRVPAAFGGIMDSYTGRRAYGLGSVFKKITSIPKKAIKAVKKLASSPIGKLALGYLATSGLAGLGSGTGMQGFYKPGRFMENIAGSWNRFAPQVLKESTTKSLPFDWKDKAARLAGEDKGNLLTKGLGWIKENPTAAILGSSLGVGALTAKQPVEELDNVQGKWDDEKAAFDAYLASLDDEDSYRVPDEYIKSAQGGRIGRQEGGLMNLGGMEKDYRNDGGFVPLGGEEKADDVPARLSRNEFVFTADAVRNAGGGDIDKGAQVMENVMKNLEAGGKVSEESQGQGAQEMFEVSERLSEVV